MSSVSLIDWGVVVKVGLLTVCVIAFAALVATERGRDALAMLALRALDALERYFERRLSAPRMARRTVQKRGHPY